MEQILLGPLKPTYTWETIELNVLHFHTANQNDNTLSLALVLLFYFLFFI